MPTTPTPSPSDRAKQFIDDIMKINNEFGMRNVTTEGAYDAAVSEATQAFSWAQRPGESRSR